MTTTPSSEALPRVRLRKREERRIRAGHLWVFSNEIDTARTPLKGLEPGSDVVPEDSTGRPLGVGYVNPASLIAVRLVGRDLAHPLSRSLLVHRLRVALSLRERLYGAPFYRLVYGESDGLPGLVVDRFGEVLVAQLLTAGMERHREEVVAALEKVLRPRTIVLRNDSAIRGLEGLERYVEVALGEAPEAVALEENGVRFEAPLLSGQKTGWYYDHRDNRSALAPLVAGRRVLDLFSYIGGWGVQAAAFGAERVTCVDGSNPALDQVMVNARLNGVEGRVETVHGDVFDALKALKEEEERYDVVIADPPAFIKRRKDHKAGLAAYARLNQLAMRLLARDGILVSASCSWHLGRDELRQLLLSRARHLSRNLVIVRQGHQGGDHPVHPAIPETDYLKAFTCRVLPA